MIYNSPLLICQKTQIGMSAETGCTEDFLNKEIFSPGSVHSAEDVEEEGTKLRKTEDVSSHMS